MKAWDKFQPLTLIGKVVNIQVGDRSYPNVYLDNLKMPTSSEDRVQVYFITEAGAGQPGYIRSRAVEIIATNTPARKRQEHTLTIGEVGSDEVREYNINQLAGDRE